MTLRDELAAVLGPGNDEATAYAQADNVIEVLVKYSPGQLDTYLTEAYWNACTCFAGFNPTCPSHGGNEHLP